MVHITRPVSQLCTVLSYSEMPRNRNMTISATLLHNDGGGGRRGGGDEEKKGKGRERGRKGK